jgi:hypothetical protein
MIDLLKAMTTVNELRGKPQFKSLWASDYMEDLDASAVPDDVGLEFHLAPKDGMESILGLRDLNHGSNNRWVRFEISIRFSVKVCNVQLPVTCLQQHEGITSMYTERRGSWSLLYTPKPLLQIGEWKEGDGPNYTGTVSRLYDQLRLKLLNGSIWVLQQNMS